MNFNLTNTAVAVLSTTILAFSSGSAVASTSTPYPYDDSGKLRDLSTDRPDQTESPYTVDKGKVQIEWDWFNYTKTGGAVSINTLPVNLKFGVMDNFDIQFVFDNFSFNRVSVNSITTTNRSFGDLTVRGKVNVWGNDSGKTSFAVMPALKIPLNKGGHLEGSLMIPLAVSLPAGFGLGIMTQFDYLKNLDKDGYHLQWVNTATISRNIVGTLGAYIEGFSSMQQETGDFDAMFDAGLTLLVNKNVQLDLGGNFGLTKNVEDYKLFTGMSVRF